MLFTRSHSKTLPAAGLSRQARCILLAAIVLLMLAGMALAGEVRLKGTAFVEPDEPITLSMIATLTGSDAQAHADLIVIEDAAAFGKGQAWFEVSAETLSKAMAAGGVNLGRLAITGSPCTVRLLIEPQPKPERREPKQRERIEPQPIEIPLVTTVRSSIAASVCGMLGLETQDLRLAFPGSEADWLDTPRPSQRVLALTRTSPNNARLLVEVRIYEGETLIEAQTVRVDALIRRTVLTLAAGVERGETITEASLLKQTQWIEPTTMTPVASAEEVVGTIARRRLPSGTILLPSHIEQPVMVRRSELVRVTAITRGVVVETEAHALADGKVGDRILVRRAGSNERFTAVVEGRGRVVVRLD